MLLYVADWCDNYMLLGGEFKKGIAPRRGKYIPDQASPYAAGQAKHSRLPGITEAKSLIQF